MYRRKLKMKHVKVQEFNIGISNKLRGYSPSDVWIPAVNREVKGYVILKIGTCIMKVKVTDVEYITTEISRWFKIKKYFKKRLRMNIIKISKVLD